MRWLFLGPARTVQPHPAKYVQLGHVGLRSTGLCVQRYDGDTNAHAHKERNALIPDFCAITKERCLLVPARQLERT